MIDLKIYDEKLKELDKELESLTNEINEKDKLASDIEKHIMELGEKGKAIRAEIQQMPNVVSFDSLPDLIVKRQMKQIEKQLLMLNTFS